MPPLLGVLGSLFQLTNLFLPAAVVLRFHFNLAQAGLIQLLVDGIHLRMELFVWDVVGVEDGLVETAKGIGW